jgi:hypothetical protein
MDWKLAIGRNRDDLLHIVEGMLAVVHGRTALPRPVCRAIRAILRPAEAALRRLIVVAAALLAGSAAAIRAGGSFRPLPDFSAFASRETRPAFPLIDPRKRFVPDREWQGLGRAVPRIWVSGFRDPVFQPEKPEETGAATILRRIAALDLALKSLPRQARRLQRLMERRKDAKPGPGAVGPIRPGRPPGHRSRHSHAVDAILRECHWLAREAERHPP